MQEKSILLINNHFKDVNPMQCGWHHCAPDHAFGPAVRYYHLLHDVVSGKGQFFLGDKAHILHADNIFVIRPGETTFYKADSKTPWHYIWIGFECNAQMADLLKEDVFLLPTAKPLFTAMASCDKLIKGREWFLCGKLYELFTMLISRASIPYTRTESIHKAITYMDTEYMKEISVLELAQSLNMNRSHFSVLFKAETGVSPQQYLTRLRMEKAINLISDHRFSVSEAAAAVGYSDIYAFSRLFKIKYGMSPTHYLKEQNIE